MTFLTPVNGMPTEVKCSLEDCFFRSEDGKEYHHVCQYCTRNEKSEEKEKDYSTTLKEGGY